LRVDVLCIWWQRPNGGGGFAFARRILALCL